MTSGSDAEDLAQTSEGCAMVLRLDDIEVQLLYHVDLGDAFFTRVVLAPTVPQDDAKAWGDWLEANFTLCLSGGPVFSCDPEGGGLLLQHRWPLSIEPQALLASLTQQCRMGAAARDGRVEQPSSPDRLRASSQTSSTRVFRDLAQSVGRHAALPAVQVLELTPGSASFVVALEGVPVQVCYLAHCPGQVHVMGELAPRDRYDPGALRDLAMANAWLLTTSPPRVACRMPLTGDCVVVMTLPLAGTDGEQLLRHALGLSRAIQLLRQQVDGFKVPAPTADYADEE